MSATAATAPRPLPTGSERAEPATARLGVEGMHCASCVARVERELSRVPGVLDAAVNLTSAQAIVTGARERGIEPPSPERFEAVPGHGVSAQADGRSVLLGNRKLMGQHRDLCSQEPAHEQPVRALDRTQLDPLDPQELDQRGDALLVMGEALGAEHTPRLIGDVHVMPLTGPVDPADCAHRSSSCLQVDFKEADQEVRWRMLIGRPSEGRRPVVALGASHRREAHVSCRPSTRQAPRALSREFTCGMGMLRGKVVVR